MKKAEAEDIPFITQCTRALAHETENVDLPEDIVRKGVSFGVDSSGSGLRPKFWVYRCMHAERGSIDIQSRGPRTHLLLAVASSPSPAKRAAFMAFALKRIRAVSLKGTCAIILPAPTRKCGGGGGGAAVAFIPI